MEDSAAVRGPTAAMVVAALLLVPASLTVAYLEPDTATWWPSLAVATGSLLLVGRRTAVLVAVAFAAVIAPAAVLIYDVGPGVGLLATVPTLAPAALGARLLRPRSDGPATGAPNALGTPGYHLRLLAVSLLCGVLTGLAAQAGNPDAASSAMWGLSATVGALASLLVVLPLLLGSHPGRSTGGSGELVLQRGLLLLVVVATASPASWAALTLLFPLLAWATLRATAREAHLQVSLVGLALYAASVAGAGPLAPPRWDALPTELSTLPVMTAIAALSYLVVPLTAAVHRLRTVTSEAVRDRRVVEQMLDTATTTAFLLTDARGRLVRFNRGASDLLGHAPDDVIGQHPVTLTAPGETERLAAELGVPADPRVVAARMAELGTSRDVLCLTAEGETRVLSINVVAITDGAGVVEGYLATGADVTQRAHAHAALTASLAREHEANAALEEALRRERDAVRSLREADTMKSELVNTVSHELRTPVTSIAGYVEVLRDADLGDLTPAQDQALARVERNTDRLRAIIGDLLDLGRVDARVAIGPLEDVDLRDAVRTAWELVEDQLSGLGLSGEVALPSSPVPVTTDPAAVERVVVNLLSNALKFTPASGTVTASVTVADGRAVVTVRDTGLGMSDEDRSRVFERFYRSADASRRAIQGTGLGLPIVAALVAALGGTVALDSTLGEGTTVRVALPVGTAPRATAGGDHGMVRPPDGHVTDE